MNPESFKNTPSGRLIKTGEGTSVYYALVPNPLPPELTIDSVLLRTLSDADRALGELAGLGRTMPNPQLLIGPFIRREAVLSSRIEGTQADLKDLYAFEASRLNLNIFGPNESQRLSDVREVSNYVRAMEYGLERIKTLPISLRLIRELHERLMEGVRGDSATPGEFRRSQNWIGRPGSTLNDALFVPPPVQEMHQVLDVFEKYLHAENEYPPLIRLALIHYQFEATHSFLDGNGRIGRLLLSLLLVHWNLLPLPLLYLSAFFERNRQDYYNLLLAVSERGAWHEWVFYFLRGVAEQARDAISRAKRLQDLQIEWRKRLTRARASALLPRLADHLFQSPAITIPHAQQVLRVTYHSAKRAVEKLLKAGILQEWNQSAYGKLFLAGEILQKIRDLEV
jgi:Fic family protein